MPLTTTQMMMQSAPACTPPRGWRLALYIAISSAVILLSAALMEASAAGGSFVGLDAVGRASGALYAWDAAGRRASLSAGGRTAEFVVGLEAWRAGDDVRPMDGAARIGPAGTVEVPTSAAEEAASFLRGEEAPSAVAPRSEPSARPAPRPARAAPAASAAPAPFIRTIVIDAGHGGDDVGALSRARRNRIREKDVNLGIALRLRDALTARHGARIVMTRDRDVFVTLEGRVRIAREAGADLFISIHANAARGRRGLTASGTEVYFFSNPTDADAARVAQDEGVFDVATSGIDPVLWDLMLAGNVIESNALAKAVSQSLPGAIGLARRGVKSARFYVLHYGVVSNIPSILIEVGYVSNPTEAARLARPDVQTKAAEAISEAVLTYLADLDARYPDGAGWRRD